MKKFTILLLIIAASVFLSSRTMGQEHRSDLAAMGLQGAVRSVVESQKGLHGQQIGHKRQCFFNVVGNYEKVRYFDTASKVQVEMRYTYDSLGQLSRSDCFNIATGELVSETRYLFNHRTHTLTATFMGIADSLEGYSESLFDQHGNLLSTTSYDEDNHVVQRTVHSYDADNNCVKTEYLKEDFGKYLLTELFRYDTHGNVIESKSLHMNTLRQRLLYMYDFDEAGNWVHCNVYHVLKAGAELLYTIEREITYFE